jgi:hypothetical protein
LKSKGLGGFLRDVQEKTEGNATSMTTLFGSVEAYTQIVALAGDGLVKFDKNLKNQGDTAGVADKAFAEMSNTIEGALKEVDTAFKNLVVAFKPVIPAIIAPFKVLAGTINLVADNMKALAISNICWRTFAGVMNGAALATKAVGYCNSRIGCRQESCRGRRAFLQGSDESSKLGNHRIALGVATAAAVALGNAMGDAGTKAEEAKGKQGEIADETSKISAEIDKLVNGVNKVDSALDESKEAAAELKAEIQSARAPFAALNAEQDQLTASIDNSLKIAEARHQAESAIRDVIKDQLKNQLDQAVTQQDRVKIAKQIYDIEIANAESALKLALQRIRAEVDRANIAIRTQELKLQELDVEMRILRARGQNTTEIEGAVRSQRSALNIAISTAQAISVSADYQVKSAMATFNSQKNAAALAYQQNIVAKNTSAAANESERLAAGFQKAAVAASAMSQNTLTKKIYGSTTTTTTRANITPATTSSSAGYIVPESSVASFTNNYLSGERGSMEKAGGGGAAPTISIQTGPVVQMNGQNYVTTQDMSRAVQAGVQQTLNMMRNDRGTRRAVGLA